MTATAAFNDHTPGPWTQHGIYISKDGNDYEYPVASVSTIIPDDEAWANARLIAAAPDLLAALESLEKMTSDLPLPSVHNVIRAAIEKARKGS